MTTRTGDLTVGGITSTLLRFTLPMMLGSLMQQCYNIADTLIVGRCIGSDALAAVGSAYSLMTFLISVLLGLAMGSGTVFSLQFGAGNMSGLRRSIYVSLVLIGCVTAALTVASFALIDPILRLLQVPAEIYGMLRLYLLIIFGGIPLTFLYNFYAALLRAVGDSVTPLWFLGVSVVLNIALDLLFILGFDMGVGGAALATVAAQGVSALGLMVYVLCRRPELRLRREDMRLDGASVREIASFSTLTCVQQSVMNFGILMVQGLVNTFGTAVMAAFAAAVKIDSFAYMPVQEFGNAFSTFTAQNYGAGKSGRIRNGVRSAFLISVLFSLAVSLLVFLLARPLMLIFVRAEEAEIIRLGVQYLRVEGSFYFGIGILFLLYGYYRAIRMPAMSVVLTVLSLGTRVALAYILAAIPSVGVIGIWWSIPIGWALADGVGIAYYFYLRRKNVNLQKHQHYLP